MIAEYNQELKVELVEKEIAAVELVEKEILTIELKTIDILNNTRQFVESLEAHIVTNETPTKVTSKIFQTANDYIEGSLQVTFNGLVESHITVLSDNTFSFGIDIIVGDEILVNYFKV